MRWWTLCIYLMAATTAAAAVVWWWRSRSMPMSAATASMRRTGSMATRWRTAGWMATGATAVGWRWCVMLLWFIIIGWRGSFLSRWLGLRNMSVYTKARKSPGMDLTLMACCWKIRCAWKGGNGYTGMNVGCRVKYWRCWYASYQCLCQFTWACGCGCVQQGCLYLVLVRVHLMNREKEKRHSKEGFKFKCIFWWLA